MIRVLKNQCETFKLLNIRVDSIFEKGLGVRLKKRTGGPALNKDWESGFKKGLGAPAGRLEKSIPQNNDALQKNVDETIQYYEVLFKKKSDLGTSGQGGALWSETDFNAFHVSLFEKRLGVWFEKGLGARFEKGLGA